jgi:hypothetical protein
MFRSARDHPKDIQPKQFTLEQGVGDLLNIKCVFWFSLQLSSEIFVIVRIIQRGIINVHRSSCKVLVIFVRFQCDVILVDIFLKDKYNILWKYYRQHTRQDRWIQKELAFTPAENATKPNFFKKKSFYYSSQGKRTIGRPKKRWREQL